MPGTVVHRPLSLHRTDPSFHLLLQVLHLGSRLMQLLLALVLPIVLITVVSSLSAFSPLTAGLLVLLVWILVTIMALRHLNAALAVAKQAGPLHGEAAEQLRLSGQRFAWSTLLSWLTLPLLNWSTGPLSAAVGQSPWALISPSFVIGQALTLAIPLLMIHLADWLQEGRALQDRAREVI